MVRKIDSEFFSRKAEIVAKELLGKVLVRRIGKKELRVRIVETEAYYDEKDPASRACKGGDLRRVMMEEAGKILVYGVHNNWLINFITGEKGKAEAVLIRAGEPLNFQDKTKGPGLLCKSLGIDKSLHGKEIGEEIWLEEFGIKDGEGEKEKGGKFEIVESFRIGVKKDLPKKLRFYIKDNNYVSRK